MIDLSWQSVTSNKYDLQTACLCNRFAPNITSVYVKITAKACSLDLSNSILILIVNNYDVIWDINLHLCNED